MSCWIRKTVGDQRENVLLLGPEEWDLGSLFELLVGWLSENDGKLEEADSWIADIGFNVRLDASGGGPIISSDVMDLCRRNKVEIYLSEYGLEEKE